MDKEIYEMGKEIFNYLKDNFKVYTVKECKELKDKGAYGFIYITQCKVNRKLYIGQKKLDTKDFKTYLGSGVVFTKAVDKHGRDNFERIILQIAYSQEELDSYEIKYIRLFDASEKYNRDLFYNIALGGSGACLKGENHPMYGKHHSEETRKKQSEAHKGKEFSEEHKKRISEANKGKEISEENRKKLIEANKGKHLSEEHKKRISEANKGKEISEETRRKMSKSLKGENHPMYGKHLSEEHKKRISEANKGKEISEETRRKMSKANKATGIKNGNAKSLVCIYPDKSIIKDVCMKELMEKLGVSKELINRVIKSHKPYKATKAKDKRRLEHLKTLDGIIIMYQEDYLKENININDNKAS